MNRKKLTPQEKKLFSYLKDTRNTYGESRSRSRFAIAKRKAIGHQAFRHQEHLILKKLLNSSEEELEFIESKVKSIKPKRWRKFADEPLGGFVSVLLNERKRRGINQKVRISRILCEAERKSIKRWSKGRWSMSDKFYEELVKPFIEKE